MQTTHLKNKKVLIITYYWPPAGGPGVQRWLKFVKYLPEFSIQPHVFVPENPNYPLVDHQLENEISAHAIVLKKKIAEPYQWASIFSKNKTKNLSAGIISNKRKQTWIEKALLWVRGNFFIPDARVLWVKPSVDFLQSYIKEHSIDTIITTGPPHSLHLIGMELKKRNEIQWIADFRDPWTTIGYHKELKLTSWADNKHKRMEAEVLNTADEIIVTSPSTKREFEQITQQPITLITNGYDIERIEKKPLDEKFTLSHIGTLLSNRNPRILWKVLSEIIQENEIFAKDFVLQFIGKVSDEIIDTLKEFRLGTYLQKRGYLSHEEAIVAQRSSQVLLLIEIDSPETVGIIPGKLFEYLAAERPILALGPEDADFSKIIFNTNTGTFCTYDDKERIKRTVLHYYNLYKNNQLQIKGIGIQYFSRKKLTEKLVLLLKK